MNDRSLIEVLNHLPEHYRARREYEELKQAAANRGGVWIVGAL